jgi:hypothetical protein
MNLQESNVYITNDKESIGNFIQSILKEIQSMDEILVVDRIENNIAVCENRENGKITEIDISKLPKEITEGTVLKHSNGTYNIDLQEQEKIEERIKEKMKKIWNN